MSKLTETPTCPLAENAVEMLTLSTITAIAPACQFPSLSCTCLIKIDGKLKITRGGIRERERWLLRGVLGWGIYSGWDLSQHAGCEGRLDLWHPVHEVNPLTCLPAISLICADDLSPLPFSLFSLFIIQQTWSIGSIACAWWGWHVKQIQ